MTDLLVDYLQKEGTETVQYEEKTVYLVWNKKFDFWKELSIIRIRNTAADKFY